MQSPGSTPRGSSSGNNSTAGGKTGSRRTSTLRLTTPCPSRRVATRCRTGSAVGQSTAVSNQSDENADQERAMAKRTNRRDRVGKESEGAGGEKSRWKAKTFRGTQMKNHDVKGAPRAAPAAGGCAACACWPTKPVDESVAVRRRFSDTRKEHRGQGEAGGIAPQVYQPRDSV